MNNEEQIITLLKEIAQNTRPKQKNASKVSKKVFVPPTVQEIEAYCKEKGYQVDARQFIEYYSTTDDGLWHDRDGKPVKNWKQKIISVWSKKNSDHRTGGKSKLFPITGRTCGVDGCKMPAVYKSVGGAYDNYLCPAHLPESVKIQYE